MRHVFTALVCLFAVALNVTKATACIVAESELRIFFDEIPFGLDAPIIAEVTAIEALPATAKGEAALLVRVNRIIKGSSEHKLFKITYPLTSCGPADPDRHVGFSGIVLGSLERNEQGGLNLKTIYDSDHQLRRRKKERGVQ